MDPKTKREANGLIAAVTQAAKQYEEWGHWADTNGAPRVARGHRKDARACRAEAARLRALIPTLPG